MTGMPTFTRNGIRPYCFTTNLMNAVGFLSWILSRTLTGGADICYDPSNRELTKIYVPPDSENAFTFNYPDTALYFHTWCFSTAEGYHVTLDCHKVDIMKHAGQCWHSLTVTTTGNINDGRKYCDPFQEEGKSIIMKLAVRDPRKGTFQCRYRSERAGQCHCGYAGDSRLKITRGTSAGYHEFTSMAALFNVEDEFFHCGATLIHKRVAITAAHCVVNPQLRPHPTRRFNLVTGAYRVSQMNNAEHYTIEKFIPHAGYNNSLRADIALVITKIPMWFDANVGPACLPYKFYSYGMLLNDPVTIVGWGHTEYGGSSSDVLLKGKQYIQYPNKCAGSPSYAGRFSADTMFCLLSDYGVDSCQHDSGGPVYFIESNYQYVTRYYVVGVTNEGVACGGPVPSVAASVISYLQWIQNNYPDAQYCRYNN